MVQVADAISSSRPGARRESLDAYVKRLEKLEEIANSFKGVQTSYAIQAGREIRIAVKPEVVDDSGMIVLANEIAKKIEPKLTTIEQDTEKMGFYAAERLIEMIEHPRITVIEQIVVNGKLVEGKSIKRI